MDSNERTVVKNKEKQLIAVVAILILVVTGMALLGAVMIHPDEDTVQGQIEVSEIRISGKLPGRVEKLYVEEGQRVSKGDTLVKIYSSVMEAKLSQVKALQDVASATNKKVDSGTREKLIETSRQLWQQAVAAKSIASKSYQRMENLFEQGVVSEQKRDEALAAYEVASAAEKGAKSQYELALEGAQSEDKEASLAMLQAAKSEVTEIADILQDSYLLAPVDGLISEIYPNVSELVAIGAPIMSIEKNDKWVEFNVKETLLKNIDRGTKLKIYIPALDCESSAVVFYVKDLGSYANWQATKSKGDYDVRTFKIKARMEQEPQNLKAGMSVILK